MADSRQISNPLVGSWRKDGAHNCKMLYPDRIELRANGLYHATSEDRGRHPYWDSGTYEILSPGTVKISTANDAEILYKFNIVDDKLTFEDPAGCRFSYRR